MGERATREGKGGGKERNKTANGKQGPGEEYEDVSARRGNAAVRTVELSIKENDPNCIERITKF